MNSAAEHDKARWVTTSICLAAVCAALFGVCVASGTFITCQGSVIRLPVLSCWADIPAMFSANCTAFTDGQYRPLSYALLATLRSVVDWRDALVWHLLLVVVHWANAVLVYAVACQFARRRASALLAAVAFCAHPVASVVVNNVNHFHYVLGLSLYLGSAYCYLSAKESGCRWRRVLGLGLFAAGMITTRPVATLVVVLIAYECLWRKSSLWQTARAVAPHLAIAAAGMLLWATMKPHPLYFKPFPLSKATWWLSLVTIIGATDWYIQGWLFGIDVPIVLHEVVVRLGTLTHWRLLLWGGVDALILVLACWRARRRGWEGLGLLLAFSAMIPFLSVLWNRVNAYVAWQYLYFSLVGLGLFSGGLVDEALAQVHTRWRWGVVGAVALVVAYCAYGCFRLNAISRSGLTWWGEVLRLCPDSQTANVELGKAYLARGEQEKAVEYLFSPFMRSLRKSSRAMAKYYLHKGDLYAALMHLKYGKAESLGLQYAEGERVLAAAYEAMGAVDHAEEALGRVLMANPYDVAATKQLVRLWTRKGLINASAKLVAHTLRIAPDDAELIALRRRVEALRRRPPCQATIRPVAADWIRLLQSYKVPVKVRDAIISASEGYPKDPVIQMTAAWFLAHMGRRAEALRRMQRVFNQLGSINPAWQRTTPGNTWPTRRRAPSWQH